jgi:class 3 adenylate cyclase/Tfp pilus assembly protein PilF
MPLKNFIYHFKQKEKCMLYAFLFLLSTVLHSQDNAGKSDQLKIADSLLIESKKEVRVGNYKEAFLLVEKSLDIFKIIEDDKSIANCYNQIATINYYQGEFYNAIKNFEKSRSYYKKSGFKRGVSSSANNIGSIYYSLGNYSKAIDYYKKAMRLHEDSKNELQLAATTQNLGNIYLVLNDYRNANIHYRISRNIYEKIGNKKNLALVLSSIGKVYLKEKKYDFALEYFENSLQLALDNDEKLVEAKVLYNLGELYELKLKFIKSLEYYKKSLEISKALNNEKKEGSSLIAIGSLQLKLNKKKQAINNCKRGLQISRELNIISIQEDACKCLYDSYKSTNQFKKALFFNEQMYFLKDSLNLKETTNKMMNMEFEKEVLKDSIASSIKERKAELAHQQVVQKKETQQVIFIISGCFILLIAGGLWHRLNFTKKAKAVLQIEKDRSEHLLLNILPEEIAEELKEKGFVDAQNFSTASILFTDFKSFTETASRLTPKKLVEEINVCFKAFDDIIDFYEIEKIKTIGDAYMAAGGLPKPDSSAVKNTVLAAIDMQMFITERRIQNKALNKPAFEMRVGIHVGPIVAGIVGVKKFQYDIWGDTVNTASRMESNSLVGKINISEDTYLMIKDEDDLAFEYRGKIMTKGKGELKMYFVTLTKSHMGRYKKRALDSKLLE